jgi:hypothetical protein
MQDFHSHDVMQGIDQGRRAAVKRIPRLHLRLGEAVFPVLRFGQEGCVLEGRIMPRLRGLVDFYDGSTHAFQALIVAATLEGDEILCEFKRLTPVTEGPPPDFLIGGGEEGFL